MQAQRIRDTKNAVLVNRNLLIWTLASCAIFHSVLIHLNLHGHLKNLVLLL